MLGSIGADPGFVRNTLHLVLATLQRRHVTKKWLQILAGRLVRLMLYRRETMMVLDRFLEGLGTLAWFTRSARRRGRGVVGSCAPAFAGVSAELALLLRAGFCA